MWFWNDEGERDDALEVAAAKAFVVVPRCPEGKQFVDVPWAKGGYKSEVGEPLKLTLALVDSLLKDLPIDADRVYVIGMSMGGFGVRRGAPGRSCSQRASGICGAGDLSKAKDIAHDRGVGLPR